MHADLRVQGPIDLGRTPTRLDWDREEAKREAKQRAKRIAKLQARLAAEGNQSLLVLFQALDTGGKDGAIRRVFRRCSPQGVIVSRFQVPTQEEWAHDFLWRAHKVTPADGMVGVWNRSHYGGVVVERVMEFTQADWQLRYRQINDFERLLHESGTRIVKVFLHISKAEQKQRLQRRLDDPERRWKYDPSDQDQRARWGEFQDAYEEALAVTSTEHAPWYVVPADDKRVRDALVARLVEDTLLEMDPQFPRVEGLPDNVD